MTPPKTYYNDNEPTSCEWLRQLAGQNLIAPGTIDPRSIADVKPTELAEYTACHFFAGIGGWSYALKLAGWPEDREVWTGSCPCQPLSCAGLQKGHADERHLWPAFYRLISERRPATIFGEQVANEVGREWLSGVRADLEGIGYAFGAADLCAACVKAPQKRQRIYWVSHRQGVGSRSEKPGDSTEKTKTGWTHPASSYRRFTDRFGNSYRIPESEIPFLDDGFPGILDLIRGFGNAVVPQLGAEFVSAFLETEDHSQCA